MMRMPITGPNVALIVANSIAYGKLYRLVTLGGTAKEPAILLALFTPDDDGGDDHTGQLAGPIRNSYYGASRRAEYVSNCVHIDLTDGRAEEFVR